MITNLNLETAYSFIEGTRERDILYVRRTLSSSFQTKGNNFRNITDTKTKFIVHVKESEKTEQYTKMNESKF